MQGKGRSLTSSRASFGGAAILDDIRAQAIAPADAIGRDRQATAPAWYAIWTRSHTELLVCHQLDAKGFDVFLPLVPAWTMRRGARQRAAVPLFPGYLFVHHAMDKHSHTEVIKARGVVRVLGERWDRLATIDEGTITGLRRVVESGLPIDVRPRLTSGARVRVTAGPFAGLTGCFLRERTARGLFVVSIDLLQRSVAVEIDGAQVEAI